MFSFSTIKKSGLIHENGDFIVHPTYDKIMLSIISTIKKSEGNNNYYLLGVDELSNSLLEHEFAHAMWFTLPEYKSAMTQLNNECDKVVKDSMFKCITEYGYADHVLPDELQAYMSTGLGSKMKEMNKSKYFLFLIIAESDHNESFTLWQLTRKQR
jgi:hypothetical protein